MDVCVADVIMSGGGFGRIRGVVHFAPTPISSCETALAACFCRGFRRVDCKGFCLAVCWKCEGKGWSAAADGKAATYRTCL